MHAATFVLVAAVVVTLALRRAPSWGLGILALWVLVDFMPTVSVPRMLHIDMLFGVLLYGAPPAAAAITTVVLIGRPPRR